MPTDVEWTWTILMADGKLYHIDRAVPLQDLLACYQADGYHLAEIEAIIRH